MDWDDARLFLAIARAGSLGGAARAVGSTQPTMGRRLAAFEQSLGLALFQRTPDGFVLTDEGATVLAHAERMEDAALGFERALAGREGTLEGPLRLSSSDWFGVHVLAPRLADFRALHPGVVIELVTDARLLDLARREADLVFRIRPFDEPDVSQRRLMTMAYALYGAPGADRTTLITMDAAFATLPDVDWLQRMLPAARIGLRSNHREVQARWCAAGAGLAVLPCLLGDATPGIARIDLGESPPSRDVYVGYHRDLRRLARLRGLLDFLVSSLSDAPASPASSTPPPAP